MSDRESLRQRLRAGVSELQLALDDAAIGQLLDYVELLERWNAAYNLTAVRDPAEMVTRHLLDSLAILPHVHGATLADLGSGAGLPGIPLAIVGAGARDPAGRFERQEGALPARGRAQLGLAHARVAESRVENVEGTFDCITARAFASLGEMLGWAATCWRRTGAGSRSRAAIRKTSSRRAGGFPRRGRSLRCACPAWTPNGISSWCGAVQSMQV